MGALDLERAIQRLVQACAGLEEIAEQHEASTCEQVEMLDRIRAENVALRDAQKLVAERLETAISRLRALLDE
jgi:hypothetical protein